MSRRILIPGGQGALGRPLAHHLAAAGWEVRAPGRRDLDVTSSDAVAAALDAWRPDVVINCAAWTDVAGAECSGTAGRPTAYAVNAYGADVVAHACVARHVACLHVSSDYVTEDEPSPAGPAPVTLDGKGRVYAATKAAGEALVLIAGPGTAVARVSTLDPAKVAAYGWLNGYTRSSREWVDDCARRLVAFLSEWRPFRPGEPRIWHLAPPGRDTTVAALVRARYPGHPALTDVVTDPEEFLRRTGYRAPLDVRLGGCPALLPGEVVS